MSLNQRMMKKQSQSDTAMGTKQNIPTGRRILSRFMSLTKNEINWDEIVQAQADAEALNSPDQEPSVIFDVDESQQLANELIRALRPLELFMKILFRFPLVREVVLAGGHYRFTFVQKSVHAIGFQITSVMMFLSSFFIILNMYGTVLNYPSHGTDKKTGPDQLRLYEIYLIFRNSIPLGMIVFALIHTSMAALTFYKHRHFAARVFTFWTQCAGAMKVDLSEGIRKYMIFVLTTYGIIWILLIALTIGQFIPMASGTPGIFAQFLFRIFSPNIFLVDGFSIIRSFCAVWLIYIFICSKVDILLFVFQCKVLVNAFNAWNMRLDSVLHQNETASKKDKTTDRTEYSQLFKDHVCLLDLIEGSDSLFGFTVLTYYGTAMGSICFEVYYLFRSQLTKTEFVGVRQLDGVYIFLFLSQSIFMLFIVSKSAGAVSQTAMEGIEILRRKGYMGNKRTDEDLYFVLSLFLSFTGHFESAVTASKFFVINNATMITVLASVFTYFVILIQLAPRLSYFPANKKESNFLNEDNIRMLLANFESTWDIGLPKFLDETSTTRPMPSNMTNITNMTNIANMTSG